MGTRIIGTGIGLPAQKISNESFSEGLTKTLPANMTRYWAGNNESAIGLGTAALQNAINDCGRDPADIDLVISFSGMPDYQYPKDGNAICHAAGLDNAACINIDTACSSFITGLNVADALFGQGVHKRAAVVMTMHWAERAADPAKEYPTLGDASAAVILEKTETDQGLKAVHEHTYGQYFEDISLKSAFATGNDEYIHFGDDSGFGRFLAKGCTEVAKKVLPGPDKADWFLAHQPSDKMVTLWAKLLKLDPAKALNTFAHYGNLSAVNIPITLHHFLKTEGKIKEGDTLLFFSPGAGLHVSAMLWQL